MQFFICKHEKIFLYAFPLPRHHSMNAPKILHNWRDFLCVCCSCHYSYMSWKFEHFINNNVHILFLCFVDEMLFSIRTPDSGGNIFIWKILDDFDAILEHNFYFNLSALYNVNWSTISEWLEEIKVDVNDLIWNLQYCIEKFEIQKIYFVQRCFRDAIDRREYI